MKIINKSLKDQMIDYLYEFKEKGFFSCTNILDDTERKRFLSKIDQIETGSFLYPDNKKERDPNKPSQLRKINDLSLNDQYFFQIARKPVILDIVEKCIGEDIKLFGDQLFMKPPGGVEKTCHQDSPYFSISPMNLISCWIALDNVNEENGCLKVLPGSHKWGPMPHSEKWMVGDREDMCIPQDKIPNKIEVSIPLNAGNASFHHSLLVHRSGPNRTSGARRGWAIHYMSSKSKWTGKYEEKPDFELLRGKNYLGCV